MNRRILVVGAGGFLGTRLVPALREARNSVVAVTRREPVAPLPDVEYIQAFDAVHAYLDILGRCDAVVWLASDSTPGSSAGDPLHELDHNIRPFLTMLTALQQRPAVELLFISTGGAIYGDLPAGLADESLRLRPKSYYSAGKATAEHFVSACCHQFHCRATILRPSNVYGVGQVRRSGFAIIPTAFESLAQDQELTLWGGGEATRDYLNVEDFLALCLKILAREMADGVHVYNASSAEGVSLNSLLSLIERVTGKALRLRHVPTRPVDVSRIVLDNRKAREAFAWQPSVELERGLADAWRWYQGQASR